MFEFADAPVPVRADVVHAYRSMWHHIAAPGPTMTGERRVALLAAARADRAANDSAALQVGEPLGTLVDALYHRPTAVNETMVRAAADAEGDPPTVEAIGLVCMLSSVDGTHRALGLDLEPLPEPVDGPADGHIRHDLKRRHTHIPVPPGPIPVVLDMLPLEGAAFQSMFGPQYMTGREMAFDDFRRDPGLDRAQMELVSSRTSVFNECFY